MMKRRIKEIIVVEGVNDTKNLQRFLDVDTIETNGSAVSKEMIELIKNAQEYRGVIVLTDPDHPGEKIRKTITQHVPEVTHAFIKQEEGIPDGKGSIGVEHADKEAIMHALRHKYQPEWTNDTSIRRSFLRNLGLIDHPDAQNRRDALANYFRIGHVNGKQLKKRLEMFDLSEKDVKNAMDIIGRGESNE